MNRDYKAEPGGQRPAVAEDIPTSTDWRALCEELLEALEVQLDELRFDNRLCKRARAALAQPEPEHRPVWTEGICGDGAAILKDGVMQPIEDVIAALNATALAQPEPVVAGPTDDDLEGVFVDWAEWPDDESDRVLDRSTFVSAARAVLARWGRPAIQPVPEGLTYEESRDWYSYCPEDGIELHSSKELAQKAAQEIMGSYAKAAYSDGWHEDMESVSWGMILPVEQAQVVERTKAESDSGFDEWVQYALVPARWGRPTIQPVPVAEEEVATLVAALRADAECVAAEHPDLMQLTDKQLTRVADLLQRSLPTSQED
jgi:hypothetical protein